MVERGVEIGPGSMRVGRFIGRLGVVSMPAVGCGLGLVDRVVRRHVAKLEKVGWCERTPAVRGDGMLVWMTSTGLDRVGLGALPAPRAPNPFSPQILRSTRVAWAAGDIEHAGHQWIASRELALAPEGWAAEIANERGGYSRRLPDLVFWPARDRRRQAAAVIAAGLTNPRRERAVLQGWQRSILAGQYAQVHYLAGPAVVSHLRCLATDIGLIAPQLIVGERVMADEISVLPSVIANVDVESVAVETERGAASDLRQPSATRIAPPRPTFEELRGTPEQTAERQKLINELLGCGELARRRPWRRGST